MGRPGLHVFDGADETELRWRRVTRLSTSRSLPLQKKLGCIWEPSISYRHFRIGSVMSKRESPRRSDAVKSYFTESSGYWNRVYGADTVKAQVYRRRQSRILQWIDKLPDPSSSVADIGAGAGHLGVALAMRGFDVVAIDSSEAMLQRTAQNAALADVSDRVRILASDAEDLQLPAESVDIAVAVGLIPWVERPARAIAEMVRVVKPGGHIILTMDNSYAAVRFLDPGWHSRPTSMVRAIRSALHRNGGHEQSQSPWPTSHTWRQVEEILRASHLTLIDRAGIGFGPFMFLGRHVVTATLGRRLERRLQSLCDGRITPLRGASLYHVVLTQKPRDSETEQAVPSSLRPMEHAVPTEFAGEETEHPDVDRPHHLEAGRRQTEGDDRPSTVWLSRPPGRGRWASDVEPDGSFQTSPATVR